LVWEKRLRQLLHVQPRLAVRVPVSIAVWLENETSWSDRGTALNVSATGLLLETSARLEFGDKLLLRFRLPGHDPQVEALAETVWLHATASKTRAGLRFLAFRGGEESALKAFIQDSLGSRNDPCAGCDTGKWEAQLRASDRLRRSILDTVPDALVVVDASLHVIEFSSGAERVFSRARHEVLGLDVCATLLASDERPKAQELLGSELQRHGQEPIFGLFRSEGIRPDESCFPVTISYGTGLIEGNVVFCLYIRDVTQEDEEAQRRQLLNQRIAQSRRWRRWVILQAAQPTT
jgi:PAS domain S-box-containing protein